VFFLRNSKEDSPCVVLTRKISTLPIKKQYVRT